MSRRATNGPTFAMGEDAVERRVKIVDAALARRNRHAAEHELRARIVEIRIELHRLHLVLARGARLREVRGAGVGPARVRVREPFDDRLRIRRNGLAGAVELRRAVDGELHEPDREELHQLARIVLVGSDVGRGIGLLVAEHAQVDAHRGMQRDGFDQLAVIAKPPRREQIVVGGQRIRLVAERADLRHDHDLRQRERDALAQLVGAGHGVAEPDVDAIAVQVLDVLRHRQRLYMRQLERRGAQELLVDPRFVAERNDAVRFGLRGAHRGLVEEPERVGLADARNRGLGRCRRRRGRRRAAEPPASPDEPPQAAMSATRERLTSPLIVLVMSGCLTHHVRL